MSRGTVLYARPVIPPWQWERCIQISIVSLKAVKTLAIFLADPDGWPQSPSGVLLREDSAVGDDTMQAKHSLYLLGRTPD